MTEISPPQAINQRTASAWLSHSRRSFLLAVSTSESAIPSIPRQEPACCYPRTRPCKSDTNLCTDLAPGGWLRPGQVLHSSEGRLVLQVVTALRLHQPERQADTGDAEYQWKGNRRKKAPQCNKATAGHVAPDLLQGHGVLACTSQPHRMDQRRRKSCKNDCSPQDECGFE
jgi:hypothetical protein